MHTSDFSSKKSVSKFSEQQAEQIVTYDYCNGTTSRCFRYNAVPATVAGGLETIPRLVSLDKTFNLQVVEM
jgi:hypothetical protein